MRSRFSTLMNQLHDKQASLSMIKVLRWLPALLPTTSYSYLCLIYHQRLTSAYHDGHNLRIRDFVLESVSAHHNSPPVTKVQMAPIAALAWWSWMGWAWFSHDIGQHVLWRQVVKYHCFLGYVILYMMVFYVDEFASSRLSRIEGNFDGCLVAHH